MKSYKTDLRSVWHIFTHVCVVSIENLLDWLFPRCKRNGMYVGLNAKQCLCVYPCQLINSEWNLTKLMCVVYDTYSAMYVWYFFENLPDWFFLRCKRNGMYVGLNAKQCLCVYPCQLINSEWNLTKLMCVVYDIYLPMYVWYLLKIFQIDFFADGNVMACT